MYDSIIISPESSAGSALRQMDLVKKKLLIVSEGNGIYFGLISIGDIQRSILAGNSMNIPVASIMRDDYVVANVGIGKSELKELMHSFRAEFMPLIDEGKMIQKVIFWEDIFPTNIEIPIGKFNIPIVIMAGGFGSRLRPLTNVLPKPLLPIKDKTIIEDIMERFSKHGSKSFHVSVNYKAELIEYYLKSIDHPYKIEYFQEDKPLGTAGSLHLLKGKLNETFFVSNCDILIEQDYSEILKYHYDQRNEITIVSVLKAIEMPYGTIETGDQGVLIELKEKPNINLNINSGMYILEPGVLNSIPTNKFFHITDLIESLVLEKRKVGVFPVSEGSWTDIGTWEAYLEIIGLQKQK